MGPGSNDLKVEGFCEGITESSSSTCNSVPCTKKVSRALLQSVKLAFMMKILQATEDRLSNSSTGFLSHQARVNNCPLTRPYWPMHPECWTAMIWNCVFYNRFLKGLGHNWTSTESEKFGGHWQTRSLRYLTMWLPCKGTRASTRGSTLVKPW